MNYVRICLDYQRVRVYYHKSYNNLTLILSDDVKLFYTIIINFITNILSAKSLYTSDFVLIIINKLTKHAIYIVTSKDLNAESLINIL